jgi:hypothetical protein
VQRAQKLLAFPVLRIDAFFGLVHSDLWIFVGILLVFFCSGVAVAKSVDSFLDTLLTTC